VWLVDTSVWIEHFRRGRSDLADRLLEGLVLTHPYVSGELSCGNLKNREEVLSDLRTLPSVKLASDSEVFSLIEGRRLWGRGLGWVDVHLLASALLSHCRLWTLDKRLDRAAADLGLKR
jgi:predicted nucleic acid-binding protein